MKVNCLKVFVATMFAVLVAGISVQASEIVQADVRQVPGEIMWIDLQSGQLQLQSNTSPMGQLTDYRIDRDETRVKNTADNEFLQINDLHPGQNVSVDVVNGKEEKIVEKITTEPGAVSQFTEAYGEIGAIDFLDGTFTLVGRQRIGSEEQSDVSYFSFTPKDFIVMQNGQPDQIAIKPGDVVRIEFVSRDGNRYAHSITVYSPEVSTMVYAPQVVATGITPTRLQNDNGLVGPRGPTGPAGVAGEQGLTGATGPAGAVLVGERGAAGPAGPMGAQGFTGPQGPAGDVVRGPMGDMGPSGATGKQGAIGQTGPQGESIAGDVGPMGAAGPQGERGPVGDTGAVGPTTVGPAGPTGYAGLAGQDGAAGDKGSQGSTTDGVAGLTGFSGTAGAAGVTGDTGDQGAAGRVGHWTYYKEFNFSSSDAFLSTKGLAKVSEIAAYVKDNPSLQIGIDGIAVNANDQALNDSRVSGIQKALINDGVSSEKISIGELDDKNLRRDGRISVLLKTS